MVDREGKQPEQLEWDMKLWWVHCEALYATLLAFHLTGGVTACHDAAGEDITSSRMARQR